MTPAREIYQLRVVDPMSNRYHVGDVAAFLARFAGEVFTPLGFVTEAVLRITIDIVDLRTDVTVKSMWKLAADAPALAKLIGDDLDRLDADAFAREWGITP